MEPVRHPAPPVRRVRRAMVSVLVAVLALVVLPAATLGDHSVRAAPLARSQAPVEPLAGDRVTVAPSSTIASPSTSVPVQPSSPAPVPVSTTTSSPPPPPPTTTTTTRPEPARTSVDFGSGLLAEVIAPSTPGPHPTLVYVHGGGWVKGSHLDLPTDLRLESLPDRGWAVASIGYRLAARDRGVDAADQIGDVVRVIEWIRTGGAELDLGGRVVGVGHSAGGHLLTMAAATMDPVLAPDTVIGASGVYDFGPDIRESDLLKAVLPEALGCEPSDCPDEWIDSLTPGTHADPSDPRVVLVHGTSDRVVPHRTAVDYASLLDERAMTVELVLVDGGGHYDRGLAVAIRGAIDQALTAR